VKQFACGDVVPGCDARWRAESDDELFALAAVHAYAAHRLTRVTPDLVAVVRAHIRHTG